MQDKILERLGLAVIAFVFLEILLNHSRKKTENVNSNSPNIPSQGKMDNPKYVFQNLKEDFGADIARKVEQIYRLETRNFDSGQYRKGRSAGQVAHGNTFPYGWRAMESLWLADPKLAPTGFDTWKVKGKDYTYLVYPNLFAGAYSLATFLKKYGGKVGRWFSAKPEDQAAYSKLVSQQTVRYA